MHKINISYVYVKHKRCHLADISSTSDHKRWWETKGKVDMSGKEMREWETGGNEGGSSRWSHVGAVLIAAAGGVLHWRCVCSQGYLYHLRRNVRQMVPSSWTIAGRRWRLCCVPDRTAVNIKTNTLLHSLHNNFFIVVHLQNSGKETRRHCGSEWDSKLHVLHEHHSSGRNCLEVALWYFSRLER